MKDKQSTISPTMELEMIGALTSTVGIAKARAFADACRREIDGMGRTGRGVDIFSALIDMGVPDHLALAAARSMVKYADEYSVAHLRKGGEL